MSSNSSSKPARRSRAKIDINYPTEVTDVAETLAHMAAGGLDRRTPIDIVESDDDVQMLSSPAAFNQARTKYRRNQRHVIVVDDEHDVDSVPSVIPVDGTSQVGRPQTTRHHKCQRAKSNPTVINCETVTVSSDNIISEPEKKAEELKIAVPKEPKFDCPICLGELVSPCSTACGHIFCEGCIKASIETKKVCPTCRAKLTMKNKFHKIFLPISTSG